MTQKVPPENKETYIENRLRNSGDITFIKKQYGEEGEVYFYIAPDKLAKNFSELGEFRNRVEKLLGLGRGEKPRPDLTNLSYGLGLGTVSLNYTEGGRNLVIHMYPALEIAELAIETDKNMEDMTFEKCVKILRKFDPSQ